MTDQWTRRGLLGSLGGGLGWSLVPLPAWAAPDGGPAPTVQDLRAAPLLPGPAKPGAAAVPLAYDGRVPGPLLRVRHGEDLAVKLINGLATRTSLHWHGMRVANELDGVAGLTGPALEPGNSAAIRFAPPDPGLSWYHPCLPGGGNEQAGNDQAGEGLYGALIVDEQNPPPVDLDQLLIFGEQPPDGKAAAAPRPILVNGQAPALPPVPLPAGARLRLRLLNATPSRLLLLTFSGLAAQIVAIDGQPCGLLPLAPAGLPIGPGARFELLADLPAAPDQTARVALRDASGAVELATFRTRAGKLTAKPPIAALPINPRLPTRIALERALRATLTLSARPSSAREPAFPGPPLFTAKRGRPVTLTLKNETGGIQQVRPHGHVFRVLHDLDDGWDPYWRDSLLLGPGKTKHVAFVADNPGRWLIEAAPLGPSLSHLPSWFEVS